MPGSHNKVNYPGCFCDQNKEDCYKWTNGNALSVDTSMTLRQGIQTEVFLPVPPLRKFLQTGSVLPAVRPKMRLRKCSLKLTGVHERCSPCTNPDERRDQWLKKCGNARPLIAGIFTILTRETGKGRFLRERDLKICRKTGSVLSAVPGSISLRK